MATVYSMFDIYSTVASKSAYTTLDMYKGSRRIGMELGGDSEYIFDLALVPLLEETITTNNVKLLSKEQEAMLLLYFEEANSGNLSAINAQLDIFLGTYTGEEIDG